MRGHGILMLSSNCTVRLLLLLARDRVGAPVLNRSLVMSAHVRSSLVNSGTWNVP